MFFKLLVVTVTQITLLGSGKLIVQKIYEFLIQYYVSINFPLCPITYLLSIKLLTFLFSKSFII